ncbi:MAG: signal recognition particle-docking protein FtsY [Ruminococcus sp.]|nr:signal recognition particle-docking protein FtsY [Ruminococcus sp.]
MGIFSKIAAGLRKTKDSFLGGLQRIFNSFTKIDEELFEELEEQMIMSDIGVDTSVYICEQLRKKVKEKGVTDPKDVMELIQEVIAEIMGDDTGLDLSVSPAVIMVIGVNGAGKTTTIGKLCHQFKEEGKKVLVAAADTFRAAAIDQLQVWTERAGVDIVKHTEGSDPGAVVYDALEAAKARKCDVVIIDTAGRLHNKKNLMDELAKINRIIDNKAGDCSREVLLVLDATTGQNAVSQAKLFSETAPITGIVLTKLDGTAKGGIVISIKNELGIPVKLIGVGEKIDDLQPFDSSMFVDALFDTPYEEDEETEEETEYGENAEYGDEEYEGEEPEYEESEYEEETEYEADEEAEEEETPVAEEPAAAAPVEEQPEVTAEPAAAEDEDEEETEDGSDEESEEYEESDEETSDEDEESDEEENEEEAEEEPVKKKGFFSRLFGRKDKNNDK